MKRKRGNKKGKSKKPPMVSINEPTEISSINTEDNSGAADIDNDEADSGKEVGTTSLVVTDQPERTASINSSGLVNRPVGHLVYGRVKVKIKTSKTFDCQNTLSDAPTHSDTDKSSQPVGPEKYGIPSEKMEDSANSFPDTSTAVSGTPSKKAGSIKIKSRNIGSTGINPCSAVLQNGESHRKETEILSRDPRYKEHELNAALEVIKKVMKMEAAEPFNSPVNPIALGIPDYFDVIDTPMDFGTICNNLESGVKYNSSEDVFKDVQYIWNNCYKYNNKGDYVVELMKRVKKNFTKYWTAAGLHCEQLSGTSGVDIIQDAPHASNVKVQMKGGHPKHKTRKRHGVKRHKDDCLCAICVMMRRRQEREESTRIDDHLETSNNHLAQEMKQEEVSPEESPYGEDTSSNIENSSGPDADSESEEKGEEVNLEDSDRLCRPIQVRLDEKDTELENQAKGGEISGSAQPVESCGGEKSREFPAHTVESGSDMQIDAPTEKTSIQHADKTAAIEQNKAKELAQKRKRAKWYEKLRQFENPLLLKLCVTLFSNDIKTVWSGSHSLVSHQELVSRSSSIHEAMDSFMN